MLSTLVQRQKILIMPLILSLAFSWCLILCQNLAQAAFVMPSDTLHAMPETPPCHSPLPDLATELAPELSIATLNAEHCSGCDSQAAAAEPVLLAFAAVLVTWQGAAQLQWPSTAQVHLAFEMPPPRSGVPLYLAKNLLLI